MVYIFFDKKTVATHKGTGVNSGNQPLAEELHKPIIRKFRKRKVYCSFMGNIWGANLADMQLISK